MKENNIDPKKMGNYLIRRFLLVLVIIYFSNIFLDWIFQGYILPILERAMLIDEINVEGGSLKIILQIMLLIIFGSGITRLPSAVQSLIRSTLLSGIDTVNITTPEAVMSMGKVAVVGYYMLFFIIFLLIFALSAAPYLVGSIWFLRSVWVKVNELINKDRALSNEYEQKRNLMLSDIAHDIKTPITAMSGYAKALSDGLVSEDKKEEYLTSIYTKSMRVSELIDMLFEYIKLDSAGYSLSLNEEDILEITRSVAAECYPDFEAAGLNLVVDIPDEVCIKRVDKLQLSRVIWNLLNNAIKYLDRGSQVLIYAGVTVSYGLEKSNVVIKVADNGKQIEDKLAEEIFVPFSRGDESRSTSGGTGLGLSIAKKIIDLHGGSLVLDRNPGDGYTKAFVIKL